MRHSHFGPKGFIMLQMNQLVQSVIQVSTLEGAGEKICLKSTNIPT